jgi:hypothetical chaperone protein
MKRAGIDFGTTNSSMSVNEDGDVRMVSLDPAANNALILRSVLLFEERGNFFAGQEAVDRYVEDVSCGRFLRSIKTLLPSATFTGTMIGGRFLHAVDLVATFLSVLRSNAQGAGEEVDDVVIGRPVVFSNDPILDALAEDRLLQAAKRAGFKHVSFQFEPIAAALRFESNLREEESRIVLVGDFGGGTSDFAVMRVGANRSVNRKHDILALGGLYVGGDTFDSTLMWDKVGARLGRDVVYRDSHSRQRTLPEGISKLLRSWHTIPLLRDRRTREKILTILERTDHVEPMENLVQLIEENSGIALFQAVERAKIDLSMHDESLILFDGLRHPVHERVSRLELETMLSLHVEAIERCVNDVVLQSGVPSERIDNVFLAGGTSQIPLVRDMFARKFSAEKLARQDAFTSVAFGLGLSAGDRFDG